MKVKEIQRTANITWSPASQFPIYLAAGTAAQQLDATFSTSAALELYRLNLGEPGQDMELVGTMPSDCRFHKLVWGSFGMGSTETPNGVLIGGGDNGNVFVWNPKNLMEKNDCLLHKLDKHVGAVAALDINNFQSNLVATGASESEIYIWDLNNPVNPMTPGAKSQPPDDVTCLAWNKQVQHILASTYAGRCVVWDLRKNEPIIKVSDSMSRIKSKLVAWHPEVATQMCLASEDDHSPVIQLWDLRFATSPLKSLENHQRGILSMAWCPQDPDLLLSCGKDNRILCWNPNSNVQTGEVVYELPTANQWSFDVQWCPRNPAVISSCSFDGCISIYSLMGGSTAPAPPSNKIDDSFPVDPFAAPVPQQQPTQEKQAVALKKAPKWLRRPVGASFAFGGKLITFENAKPAHPQQPVQHQVHISQVVTETNLVSRSQQLESALVNGQFTEFCSMKIANSKNDVEESVWNFMKIQFEKDPRTRYLQLLGYDKGDIATKVSEATGSDLGAPQAKGGVDAAELAQKMAQLGTTGEATLPDDETPIENGVAIQDGANAFDEIATKAHEEEELHSDSPLPIAINDKFDGLVTQSLLMANFEAAVEVCLHNNKMAEAIILAIAGGPDLLLRTQKKFFTKNKSNLGRLIYSLVSRDFEHIVRTCDLENWKEALAVALTYARADEFGKLCEILGSRLESEQGASLAMHACLCYICAGNVERLVECWSKICGNTSPDTLQDLVEKVMILRKAVEQAQGRAQEIQSGLLAQQLAHYSEILAAQGNLNTAINYLGSSQEQQLTILRDRLYRALGGAKGTAVPFQVIDVKPEGVQQVQTPQQQHSQAQQRERTHSGAYAPHASMASSQFQTRTTSSAYQPNYPAPGIQAPFIPTSATTYSAPTSSAPGVVNKGPLAHKYPTPAYAATSTPYDPYSQPGYPAPTSAYNAPYSAVGYPTSQGDAGSASAPNIYNPAAAAASNHTPGAPFVPQPMGEPSAASVAPQVPSYQDVKPNTAWNDPPLIQGRKKVVTDQNYVPPAPITTPIFGVPQPPEQTPPGAPNFGTQMYNPGQYQNQPQQTQQQQVSVPKQAPPKPMPKAPIPEEHQVLHDVFDKLANQCLNSATNPQMKRKLEDVLRKLETLYDKLRGNGLSQNVILGLHQIVQAIQGYDYQTGLGYHTQMVSQGNFSEISSFMPGVKMLMQSAMQMQVYIQ